jgi:hypothetical protein
LFSAFGVLPVQAVRASTLTPARTSLRAERDIVVLLELGSN